MKLTRPARMLATLVAAAAISLGAGGALSAPAQASVPTTAPGTPGATQPGVVIYSEDFSNQDASDGAISILDYVGGPAAADETYSADLPYTPAGGQCDGWILNSSSPLPTSDAGCAHNQPNGWNEVRDMAVKLGLAQGQTPAQAAKNQILSEYTNSTSGAITAGSELRSGSAGIPAIAGHYYAVSGYFAQVNCQATHASETFSLLVNGSPVVLGAGLDPCGANTTQGGSTEITKLESAAYRIPSGPAISLGLDIRNEASSGIGNDVAVDLPQIVDVTPQVDKAFTPALIAPHGTSTLTLTVTNTDDLKAKPDWSITDNLPAGLAVAAVPNIGGTCTQDPGTNPYAATAAAGSNSVTVSGGDLAQGVSSCTVTVDVTAQGEGTYTNGVANVVTNLNPPANAALVVRAPRIALSGAFATPRLKDADQFTMEIHSGSPDGPIVNDPTASSTTGSGSLVSAGSGDTGRYIADTGTTYYLSESGVDLSDYARSITCTDANGLQPGLPAGASLSGSLAVRPVAGADISCVVANTAIASPGLTFAKSADVGSLHSPPLAGDRITYAFTAKNTGNVTLLDVAVEDPMPSLPALAYAWPGTPGKLLPGQAVTATATYSITQADIDAGHVANSSTASATPVVGPGLPVASSSTDTPLGGAPAMSFSTVADLSGMHSPSVVGDPITYNVTAKNTGNVTLKNINIVDPLPGLAALSYAWPGALGELLPGQSVTATVKYEVKQSDIDAGHLLNSVTVGGAPPSGVPLAPPPVVVDTALTPNVGLQFAKTADVSRVGDPARSGDVITYTFTARNIGAVSLRAVAINDALPGLSALAYRWPAAPGTLLPGQTMTATATYVINGADVIAGAVRNTATASGTTPAGPRTTTPRASVVVTFPSLPRSDSGGAGNGSATWGSPGTGAATGGIGTVSWGVPGVGTGGSGSGASAGQGMSSNGAQAYGSLAFTGVALTAIPVALVAIGAGMFLLLMQRRRTQRRRIRV